MSNLEFDEDMPLDLEVDFQEFIISGKFGFMNSRTNCSLILKSLGAPDEVAYFDKKLWQPIILRYGDLQLTLRGDRLERVTLRLGDEGDNGLDELPLSFCNLLSEEERCLPNIEKLLRSQNITLVKDQFSSDEYSEQFKTDRGIELSFRTETGELVFIGVSY